MTKIVAKIKYFFCAHFGGLLMIMSACLFGIGVYFAKDWQEALHKNTLLISKQFSKVQASTDDPQLAYLLGYRYIQAGDIVKAQNAYTYAETSNNHNLRARAEFGLGNLYAALALKSANIESGGSHQQAVAYVILAREFYKSALRINPDLYSARFNLELLDRRSPDKRVLGWRADTDGVTLQPFKKNGTAMMRDNLRRGLP